MSAKGIHVNANNDEHSFYRIYVITKLYKVKCTDSWLLLQNTLFLPGEDNFAITTSWIYSFLVQVSTVTATIVTTGTQTMI